MGTKKATGCPDWSSNAIGCLVLLVFLGVSFGLGCAIGPRYLYSAESLFHIIRSKEPGYFLFKPYAWIYDGWEGKFVILVPHGVDETPPLAPIKAGKSDAEYKKEMEDYCRYLEGYYGVYGIRPHGLTTLK
jgi:hypothetical protein